jgi:signal peptidase I
MEITMDLRLDFEDRDKEKKDKIKEILIWVAYVGGAILLAFLITRFGMERTTMDDASMEGTLNKGEKVIINKFNYIFTDPKRFDIIVFEQKGKEHVYYNIKRVIGMPGERVTIIEGKVYVNEKPIEEVANVPETLNKGLADETIKLGKDEYFVLGDNRNNSEDSRYSNVGNVKKADIVGKAWIRLKPFNFVNKLNLKENK